jgi:hypothetical protein
MAFSRQGTGLFAWKEREDKDNIVVHVSYHTPGNAKPVGFRATIKRGNQAEVPLQSRYQKVSNEQLLTIILPRTSAGITATAPASVIGTFHAGIFSDYIYSEWKEPPTKPVRTSETQHLTLPCAKPVGELTNEGVKNLIGAYCSVPTGQITSVKFDRCLNTTGDDVCGHIWYTGHAQVVPPGNRVDAQFIMDQGNPAGILYLTVFYDITTTKCTGEGCDAFKAPSEVLKDCPNSVCPVQ